VLVSSAYMRTRNLANNYGMTEEDFERRLKDQSGRCAICQDDISGRTDKGRLKAHIDHDHETGAVRGLLCAQCNVGLGSFKDDIRSLASAIVYLQDHGKVFE
jgi:hypothetical protein